MVGASCTGELMQDDPGGLARSLGLPVPVVAVDLPAYQRKENWGAAETFYQLVRALAPRRDAPVAPGATRPRCNLLGPTALGFRHRDDVAEVTRLLERLGIDVNVTAPLGATPADLPVSARPTSTWCSTPRSRGWRRTGCSARTGSRSTNGPDRRRRDAGLHRRGRPRWPASIAAPVLGAAEPRLPWYSRSVDSTYLTGKRVFIFADATHAVAAARIAADELGFRSSGWHLQPRIRPRDAGGRAALRSRGADHRRLSRGRGEGRRAAARAGAGHADGAAYRQTARHSLRGDLGAGARAGFPGALFAADGLRRRQRASSTPGCIR